MAFRRIPPILCLIALFFGASSFGASKNSTSFFVLDLGVYSTQVEKRLAQSGAYASEVSSLTGFFRARKGIPIFTGVSWEPSVGAMVPWRSGADGFAKTFIFHVGSNFGVSPLSWMHLRVGPGLLWRVTITNAEQVALANGTGTSNFYIPGGARSVFQLTADVGIDFRFLDSVSLGLDLWVTEIANSQRRSVNAALTLGFYL